jgi:hypothetical protein
VTEEEHDEHGGERDLQLLDRPTQSEHTDQA